MGPKWVKSYIPPILAEVNSGTWQTSTFNTRRKVASPPASSRTESTVSSQTEGLSGNRLGPWQMDHGPSSLRLGKRLPGHHHPWMRDVVSKW